MAEEPSKIKELLAAVNTSSGANLGIKVDYAAGSMLEGSLNELKQSAKMQVDYLGKLVGFQEQSLKDARLKSVQGENTEGFQKGIGSDLKDAGKAGLNAALGAGGPLGELLGLLGTGLIGAGKLAYKAIRPTNARENANLSTEERTAKARAEAVSAEEKAKFEREKSRLRAEADARTVEAERLRADARAKANEARGERVSDRTGRRLYGAAADAQQARLDREARSADFTATQAERNAFEARKTARPMPSAAAAAPVEESVLKTGARALGKLADFAIIATTLWDVTSKENDDKNKLSATVKSLGSSVTGMWDLLGNVPYLNQVPGFGGGATAAFSETYDMAANSAIGTSMGDTLNEVGTNIGATQAYHAVVEPPMKSLHWLSDMNTAGNAKIASGERIAPSMSYGDSNMLLNKMMRDYTNNGEGGVLSPDAVRAKLGVPQTSSTPPPVVVVPPAAPSQSSSTVNSNNTQNTTVIQKSDSSSVLQLGSQMPNGWTYEIPIM